MRRLRFSAVFLIAALLVPVSARAYSTESGFIESFDGTLLKYTLFLPDNAGPTNPVPAVLRTHGWGGTGETTKVGTLSALVDAGYAVMTWDSRGFGQSGGQVEIDHPDWEAKDVSSLISWLAMRSDIANDPVDCPPPPEGGPVSCKLVRDPVIGMSGGSYAGGIQLMSASIDPRIDAIAPEIAWNDLPASIFPSNIPKVGWDTALYGIGQSAITGGLTRAETGNYNPNIHLSYAEISATNDPSPYYAFFDERSPRHYIDAVTAPTLVIQGTIDTLFTINQGVANFLQIQDNNGGTPAKLLLYNDGHQIGTSVPKGSGADNARTRADDAILKWFAKYLKGETASTGPLVEFQDSTAAWHSSTSWPIAGTTLVSASGVFDYVVSGPAPTGGGTLVNGNPNQPNGSRRLPISVDTSSDRLIAGIPRITGTVSGVGNEAFLFFKLIDTSTGAVLSDQVTPLRAKFANGPFTFDMDLEGVSHRLRAGSGLALELSTGSMMFTSSREPALVDVALTVNVPVVSI